MPPEEPQRPVHETPGPPSWLAPVKPVVPDHKLLKRIGGGSYGDVWLACSVVGTWRAVKVVFRDRFLDARPYDREFNGIQNFEPLSRSNEGFVDILQIGRNDADGYFYYVMELADDACPEAKGNQLSVIGNQSVGSQVRQPLNTDHCSLNTGLEPSTYVPLTLSKVLLQRGRLPVNECLELGITLNLALAPLHKAGLIHRDIKPSNLIFVGGVPKLADIGLVIEVAEARSYVGTEGFIPPEGPNSPQADLYSLGKVLYEAGMGKDRKDFPEPPTQIADVPDSAELLEFNTILLKACAANVKDRYQSAEEMNADLALLQSGGSVRRQRKLAGQLRFVQRAGALVTTLAAVIAAGWLWQARQTHLIRQLANEKTRLAAEDRERLVRLDVANGNRYLDEGDLGQAMLWYGQALQQVTNDPARAELHRFRMANLLQIHPKLVAVLPLNVGPRVFEQFEQPPFVVAPEGRRVLARTGSGLELWDLTLPPRRVLEVPQGSDWDSFDITPDGRRFHVSSLERRTQIWTVSPDGQARITEAQGPPLDSAFFASGGNRLVGITTNRTLLCFDPGTGEPVGPPIELGQYLSTENSRRGDWCGILYSNQTTRALDVLNRRMIEGPTVGKEWISVTPVLEGRRLLGYATTDRYSPGKFQLWDMATGQTVGPPITHRKAISFWSCNSDMTLLASSSGDQTARVWSLATGDPTSPVFVHPTGVRRIVLSRDGTRAATTAMDGVVRIWDTASGRLAAPPLFHGGGTTYLQFGPDDSQLLVADASGLLRVWDLTSSESMRTSLGFSSKLARLGISPDGEVLAVSVPGETTLWRLPDLARLGSIPSMASVLRAEWTPMHFSSDSHYLALADRSDGARVWEARTGQPAGPKLHHGTNAIVEASFSPDARELATVGFQDATVRFWDWRAGVETRAPLVFTNRPERATWSPLTNRLLALGVKGPGTTAALWDLDKRKLLAEPFWCNGRYEFSRDGTRIAVADPFTNVRLLDGVTGQLAHLSR